MAVVYLITSGIYASRRSGGNASSLVYRAGYSNRDNVFYDPGSLCIQGSIQCRLIRQTHLQTSNLHRPLHRPWRLFPRHGKQWRTRLAHPTNLFNQIATRYELARSVPTQSYMYATFFGGYQGRGEGERTKTSKDLPNWQMQLVLLSPQDAHHLIRTLCMILDMFRDEASSKLLATPVDALGTAVETA